MKTFSILEAGSTRGTGLKRRAKLISANVWGSSAFYPAEVLERDASTVFVAGTQMYENHLSDSEIYERPEGDVSKLIGKLISDGVFEADNPEGPGVYADVEFYESYGSRINEIGEDIGLSVHGSADYIEGEKDGRYGRIVTRLLNVRSVDVVTKAGAGGKLVSIIESARQQAGYPIQTEGDQQVAVLTKEDFDRSIASLTEVFQNTIEKIGSTIKESLAESAVAEAPVDEAVEVVAEEAQESAVEVEAVAEESEEAVEIDHAALVTGIAEAQLPTEVIPHVVADVQSGVSIADAIAKQTTLREAFVANVPQGNVQIVEAGRESEGDLRSRILNTMK